MLTTRIRKRPEWRMLKPQVAVSSENKDVALVKLLEGLDVAVDPRMDRRDRRDRWQFKPQVSITFKKNTPGATRDWKVLTGLVLIVAFQIGFRAVSRTETSEWST